MFANALVKSTLPPSLKLNTLPDNDSVCESLSLVINALKSGGVNVNTPDVLSYAKLPFPLLLAVVTLRLLNCMPSAPSIPFVPSAPSAPLTLPASTVLASLRVIIKLPEPFTVALLTSVPLVPASPCGP